MARRSPWRCTRLLSTSDAITSSDVSHTSSADSTAKSAGKHAELREQLALGLVEQVVAPGDRVADRLLARGDVPRAPGEQRRRSAGASAIASAREHARAGGGELDRQRQSVEVPADLRDRLRVFVGERERRPHSLARSTKSATDA